MKVLVIYDNNGGIISQMLGNIKEPVIDTKLWVEIPEEKVLKKIDISSKPHLPIFEEAPKHGVRKLEIKMKEQEKTIANLAFILMESQGGT